MKHLTSIFLVLFFFLSPGYALAAFVSGDATLITSFASTANVSSYDSASVAPISGELALVAVHSTRTNSTDIIPTLSGTNGWSVTWTQVATKDYNSALDERRVTLFRGVPSSAVAGVLTVDFGGANQSGCAMSVASFNHVDQTTNQGIVQSASACAGGDCTGGTAATSVSVTLGAFGNANNATYGAFGAEAAEDQLVGTGFTQLHDVNHATPSVSLFTEWRIDNDTSVDQSSASSVARGGIAVELDYLEVAAGSSPKMLPLLGVGR